MKVCVVSDSHDRRDLLFKAVNTAKEKHGAEIVLHCGDLCAPNTLMCLVKLNLPIHVIHGNNTGDITTLCQISSRSSNHITYHGHDASLTLAGKKVFMVHYPHYANAMALTGDFDIICFGHDHRAKIERVTGITNKEAVLVDAGTIAGIGEEPQYAMMDLKKMEFSLHKL